MDYTTNGVVAIVHKDTATGIPSRRYCARLAVVVVHKNLMKKKGMMLKPDALASCTEKSYYGDSIRIRTVPSSLTPHGREGS